MILPRGFVPMKPAVLDSLDQLTQYPYLVQYKYDGLRCLMTEGTMYSNTLKEFPNRRLRKHFDSMLLDTDPMLDGELIIPGKTIQDIQSVVMSYDSDPKDIRYVVFDRLLNQVYFEKPYSFRREWAIKTVDNHEYENHTKCHTYLCNTREDLEEAEETIVTEGKMEGIIIRRPDGIYKQGRVTAKEGYFFKFKRTDDAEARIIRVKPLETNLNKKEYDERGYAKRSSMKQNKQTLDIAGSLEVIGVNGKYKDKIFFVSLGSCTMAERLWHWEQREKNKERIVTFTMAKHRGTDEAPAEPRFKCFRFDV